MALHTQTFLGNPVGCAMALACLDVLDTVVPEVQAKGEWLASSLRERGYTVQGRGLLVGIAMDRALQTSRDLLQLGFIALPAGEQAEVLALTPPLNITAVQLTTFMDALDRVRR
jgi:acetylornithine/succinyldiaminopimelate/putrescine aminotransferase